MTGHIKTVADLASVFDAWIASYEREKARWLERLDTDPYAAMDWSGGMFQEAARYWIANGFRNDSNARAERLMAGEPVQSDEEMIRATRDHAFNILMGRAERIPSSSSPTGNLINQYETKAWRDLLGIFGRPEIAA